MIILNEKDYAENCLKNGIKDNNPYFTISIIAKYYFHHFGYRKKKISRLLIEYLEKYYVGFSDNRYTWETIAERVAANAGKYPLFEISGVSITESEIETISKIKDKVLERLAFTMLCLAKLSNLRNEKNNGWVNTDTKDIFKLARIACKVDEREIKIGELGRMGLLEFSKRNDNLNSRVTFIDDESKQKMFIKDFREIGYEYMLYKGENLIRCAECQILTRGNKYGNKRYCRNCVSPQITKKVICVDCGKQFEVKSKNNQTRRCADCYVLYRRDKIRQNTQKHREKYRHNQQM